MRYVLYAFKQNVNIGQSLTNSQSRVAVHGLDNLSPLCGEQWHFIMT